LAEQIIALVGGALRDDPLPYMAIDRIALSKLTSIYGHSLDISCRTSIYGHGLDISFRRIGLFSEFQIILFGLAKNFIGKTC
jgi:hypothetical protein